MKKTRPLKNLEAPAAPPAVAIPGEPWQLYNLSGLRADARAKVEALTSITPATRAYILELIDALPPQGGKLLLNHSFSVNGIS